MLRIKFLWLGGCILTDAYDDGKPPFLNLLLFNNGIHISRALEERRRKEGKTELEGGKVRRGEKRVRGIVRREELL